MAVMEVVVRWEALLNLIETYYPKTRSKGGRPPYPLETMLRIHLLQQWHDLSDPAMEDALIEMATMRRFAGIDMINGLSGHQAAVRLSEEPAAGNAQEPLQSECAGSTLEPIHETT